MYIARHVLQTDLESYEQPRPIVLDNRLELPLDCKLLKNYNNGTGRKPWILTTASSSNPAAVRKKNLLIISLTCCGYILFLFIVYLIVYL